MLEDVDIIPYFTPCRGHFTKSSVCSGETDEIDGVLQMQAYCKLCYV